MKDVRKYYDEFSEEQEKTGTNKRHFAIQNWLKKFGISESSIVLEIGCGIGTQTELIASDANKGFVTALDISPKSVELAKKRLAHLSNIEFIAADVIAHDFKKQYDIIVLPDVLEHIPIEQHTQLFEKLSKILKPSGYIFIHIPNPYYLEWCHVHETQYLQVIDQPIYTDILAPSVYKNGLYIHYLNTYTVWIDNCDYQAIVLKPVIKKEYKEIIPPIPPLNKRIMIRVKKLFK